MGNELLTDYKKPQNWKVKEYNYKRVVINKRFSEDYFGLPEDSDEKLKQTYYKGGTFKIDFPCIIITKSGNQVIPM